MDEDQSWWYCLKHATVEHGPGCPGKDRLGPFASREEAARALEIVHERNREWDTADEDPPHRDRG
jgi:hypothetical protein